MMASLVANYGSDSSNSSEDFVVQNKSQESQLKSVEVIKLAPAEILLEEDMRSKPSSVFTNPYKEAEKSHTVLLERHVKMTDVKQQITEKKQKICWKFKKGKCFEVNCPFSHELISNIQNKSNSQDLSEDSSDKLKEGAPQKKRCGVTDSLIPPKKFMKSHIKNSSRS